MSGRARSLATASALIAALALTAPGPGRAAEERVAVGAYLPNQWKDPGEIDRYAREVGQMPAIILAYKRWDVKPFYPPELRQIAARGAVPMISWEPWDSTNKPKRLWSIARGRFDAYVRRSARAAREWGRPIMLRFGQEMNGLWAPWEKGKQGSTPKSFVLAWRHLVSVFREMGADNVLWVWCPNVNNGSLPFMQYYPGDRWVDWVGLDGFNWGGSIGWRSFSEIFAGSYQTLVRETPKPVVIAETGSGQTGGDKAEWVTSALQREIPNFRRLRAVVWYDSVDRADFRVNSSAAALRAFRQGLDQPRYRATGAELAATPTSFPLEEAEIEAPGSGFGAPSLPEELWRKARDRLGPFLWPAIAAALLALAALAALAARRGRDWRQRKAGQAARAGRR